MFSESFREFKYAMMKSKFVQHVLENNHSIGPIDSIMKVLYSTNKGILRDSKERFYIYKATHDNINMVKPNIIFDTIVCEESQQSAHQQITNYALHKHISVTFHKCSFIQILYTRP